MAKFPSICRALQRNKEYLPSIYDEARLDRIIDISQEEADETARQLAIQEGIFAGMSSGGAVSASLKIAAQEPGSVIACIVCDRGDRYLSTGVFDPPPPVRHSCYYKNLELTLSHHQESLPHDMPIFLLFTAPWCPDCTTALPIIDEIFATELRTSSSLLRCIVGKTRDEWKDPHHPLRLGFDGWMGPGITAVPTLAFLGTASAPLARPQVLSGLETINQDEVHTKVKSFLKETGSISWSCTYRNHTVETVERLPAWLERTFKSKWMKGATPRKKTQFIFTMFVAAYICTHICIFICIYYLQIDIDLMCFTGILSYHFICFSFSYCMNIPIYYS